MGPEAKTNVVELNLALDRGERNWLRIFRLFCRCIDHIRQTLNRDLQRLNSLPRTRQTNDRPNNIAADDAESDKLADGQLSFKD